MSFTCLGGKDEPFDNLDEILEYEASTGDWSLVDTMMRGRTGHEVSVISTEKMKKHC